MILSAGQGASEEWNSELLYLSKLLNNQINHKVDLWDYDMPHDWPIWKLQMKYFLNKLDKVDFLNPSKELNSKDVNNFIKFYYEIK